jgi:CubicO group peptidase (beta-lactamase class C family)
MAGISAGQTKELGAGIALIGKRIDAHDRRRPGQIFVHLSARRFSGIARGSKRWRFALRRRCGRRLICGCAGRGERHKTCGKTDAHHRSFSPIDPSPEGRVLVDLLVKHARNKAVLNPRRICLRSEVMTRASVVAAGLWLLLGLFGPPAQAQAGRDDADVIGLWYYQTHFPVGLEGELAVTRRGDRWRATIAGQEAQAVAQDRFVRIDFAGDGAVWRGYLDARGRLERAYWARREMTHDPRYPEGAAQAYAGPLTLRADGANRWRATVEPLQDPLTLYLNIYRDGQGVLLAAIRNPEHNRHGPAMQLFVTRQGPTLRLGAATAPSESDLAATLMADPERITMYWEGVNRFISLSRATPEQAGQFTARPRTEARYTYRPPQDLGDGWRIARASELGVDEAGLARAVHWITDIDPSVRRGWMVHSMAVAYRGRLILDEYFYGYDAATPHDMRSASKALSSITLGALMMEGASITPDTPITQLLAPFGPFANPDPRKDRIRVRHALTHTTGLACDDAFDEPLSPGSENIMQTQREEPNWWRFMLNLPMAHEPGERYAYCSGGISLAGGALTMASGEWLPSLFDRTIARPLQFQRYYWNLMASGEGYVGGGAFVRTRDFLKLGQAYLDGGVWNGRRIATQDFVREAFSTQIEINQETTGVEDRDRFANAYYEVGEGLGWHHAWVQSGDQRYAAYHTNGNGGQLLLIVPAFDLVVMFTAGNYRTGLWNLERDAIVGQIIIPALNRAPAPN